MDTPTYLVRGRRLGENAPEMQEALAELHGTSERPRCLCVRGGIDMYIAKLDHWVLKRMPGTGAAHHPSCKSFEPGYDESGLGELIGDAVIEVDHAPTEIHVNFALKKSRRAASLRAEASEPTEVKSARRKMSLRAVTHFLFDRAGFNRWSPAMEGKRSQAVIHKYLMEVADNIMRKGVPLSTILIVPEQFNEQRKFQIAEQRRQKLLPLLADMGRHASGLAIVLGELKNVEESWYGKKILLKHMGDMPLFIDEKSWKKIESIFHTAFLMKDAEPSSGFRMVLSALIYPRTETAYCIQTACLMVTTANWIPVASAQEGQLLAQLTSEHRHFMKPLAYDSKHPTHFASALLLDAGSTHVPLHCISTFWDEKEKEAKAAQLRATLGAWLWHSEGPMPALPKRIPRAYSGPRPTTRTAQTDTQQQDVDH